jgi:hypothetical protein
MKQSSYSLLVFVLLFSVLITQNIFADENTENLESVILESFDPDDRSVEWKAFGSKFIDTGENDGPGLQQTYVEAWPEALFGSNKEGTAREVLGIHAGFQRAGYNYIEFIPGRTDENGEFQPEAIPIPGRVKRLDLWAWGANYDYFLEVHIIDFNERVHVLELGSVQYTGWQNLFTLIPPYIPQAGGYVTEGGYNKNLQLVKIVLWTKPAEKFDSFYFYMDQIKVLTDTFVSRFDGDELADPENIQSIWQEGGNQ